ncbi:MAG: hypothetical protein P9L91_08015, partial [Candidatus Zophobacter franzmannii]|nr:hypothetical protein [Candidatus Zophobacter franzmannii]
ASVDARITYCDSPTLRMVLSSAMVRFPCILHHFGGLACSTIRKVKVKLFHKYDEAKASFSNKK